MVAYNDKYKFDRIYEYCGVKESNKVWNEIS